MSFTQSQAMSSEGMNNHDLKLCVCVCVCCVGGREKENRDIDREGECRVGRALVSFASRPPPCVCKA